MNKITTLDNEIAHIPIEDLRRKWAELWDLEPHLRIGRAMLEKSVECKLRAAQGGGFTAEQQKRLDHLMVQYRRNPDCFTQNQAGIKPGTKLMRHWRGVRHTVTVLEDGRFDHQGKKYTSLSQIAFKITGTRWNGWRFFGLKNKRKKT